MASLALCVIIRSWLRKRHEEEGTNTAHSLIVTCLCLETIFIKTFPNWMASVIMESSGVFCPVFWGGNKKINCFLYHAWPATPGIHQRRGPACWSCRLLSSLCLFYHSNGVLSPGCSLQVSAAPLGSLQRAFFPHPSRHMGGFNT